jgi:hypothetical protein
MTTFYELWEQQLYIGSCIVAKRLRITSDLHYCLGEVTSSLCTYNTTAIINVYLMIIQCLPWEVVAAWVAPQPQPQPEIIMNVDDQVTRQNSPLSLPHIFILMSSASEEPVARIQDLPMESALVAINNKTMFSK